MVTDLKYPVIEPIVVSVGTGSSLLETGIMPVAKSTTPAEVGSVLFNHKHYHGSMLPDFIHVRIVGFDTTGNAGYSMPLYFKMQDADAPSVTMSYPHGRSATLHISEVDQNGAITAIEIVDGGIGYTDQYPSEIAIFSTNGSGAELSAEIDESGKITNINIDNSGLGYSVNDGISTSAPFRYNPAEPITLSALAHDPYGEFEQFHFRVNGVYYRCQSDTQYLAFKLYSTKLYSPFLYC